jgi:hypothetical protein
MEPNKQQQIKEKKKIDKEAVEKLKKERETKVKNQETVKK